MATRGKVELTDFEKTVREKMVEIFAKVCPAVKIFEEDFRELTGGENPQLTEEEFYNHTFASVILKLSKDLKPGN